jgi:ribosomal protein L37AE/L43A
MAGPCCPKCLKKVFHRQNIPHLSAGVIYCVHCGTVVGAVPLRRKSTTKTGSGSSGNTTQDDWETPA